MACEICGRNDECTHHLIFGANRRLADEDGLTIRLCNSCHNMAVKQSERVHGNIIAENLSKKLGQALWEREYIAKYEADIQIEAREAFMKRYGRSYL